MTQVPYGRSTISCFLLKLDYKGKERKKKKEDSVVLFSLASTVIFSLGTKILTAQSKKADHEDKTMENELNIMLLENSHPFHLNYISDITVS